MQGISYQQWLNIAQNKCKESGVELSAPLIFLEQVLQKNKAYILSHLENTIDVSKIETINAYLDRRLQKEPLAYILENKEFYGRDFYVDENVLIPRPETELLIDEAKKFFAHSPQTRKKILDIGTGSGCISISLALEIENSSVTSYDISSKALEIAKKNAITNNAYDNINFELVDITKYKNHSNNCYDCIISNPPYIPEEEYKHLDKDVHDFEPKIALTSGTSGLEIIEEILLFADNFLLPKGILLIEHGYNQNTVIEELADKVFTQNNWLSYSSMKDYANQWRVFKAIKK